MTGLLPRRRLREPDWWQQLLEPRESPDRCFRVLHHWVAYVRPALYGVLAALLLLSAVLTVGRSVSGYLAVTSVAAGIWAAASWQMVSRDMLIVTDLRIFKLSGIVAKTMAAMPLSKLVDLTVHQPVPGRLLGYGHLTFESAAQKQGLDSFRCVGDVVQLSKRIQERAHAPGDRRPRGATASGVERVAARVAEHGTGGREPDAHT